MMGDRITPFVESSELLSDAEPSGGQWRKVNDQLWVQTCNSTRVKLDLLLRLCDQLGIRPGRFKFDVKMSNR